MISPPLGGVWAAADIEVIASIVASFFVEGSAMPRPRSEMRRIREVLRLRAGLGEIEQVMSKHLFIAALLLASASCSTPAEQKPAAPAPPAPTLSATPFAQSAALQPPAHEEEILPPPEIRRGSGRFVGSGPSSRTVAATPEGQTTLNFVNADIADVAKAVLGDLL